MTPRLTDHARQRCREMGLGTKEVKRAFRLPALDYPGPERHGHNRLLVGLDGRLAIAYRPGDPPVVMTVLWNGQTFTRPNAPQEGPVPDTLADRLASRPMDTAKGLPIPFVAEAEDGGADFAAVQGDKTLRCAKERLCGICGTQLDYWIAFLGGPRAAEARTYVDPPMHEDCAVASTQLCPHIARRAPKRSAKLARRDDVITPDGFVDDKPDVWVMLVTRSFRHAVYEGRQGMQLVYTAGSPHRIRRFVYDDDGHLVEEVGRG